MCSNTACAADVFTLVAWMTIFTAAADCCFGKVAELFWLGTRAVLVGHHGLCGQAPGLFWQGLMAVVGGPQGRSGRAP